MHRGDRKGHSQGRESGTWHGVENTASLPGQGTQKAQEHLPGESENRLPVTQERWGEARAGSSR